MVLPLIVGIAGYGGLVVAKSQKLISNKTYKTILYSSVVLTVGIVGYFVYKLYTTKESITGAITAAPKNIYYLLVTEPKEKAEDVLKEDERYEELMGLPAAAVYTGEYISQLFGGSAYETGQDIAKGTYESLQERYGQSVADDYEMLNVGERSLVTLGDWLTGGTATEAGYQTGEKLKEIYNKIKFW